MLPINFGLSGYAGLALYVAGIVALLLTVFRSPIVGVYYLVPLIPLQTIRYRLNEYPLGASVIGVMVAGIAIGLLRQRRSPIPRTPWTLIICFLCAYTFISLWQGSSYLGTGFPAPGETRFGVWQEFIMLPLLLLLVAAIQPSRRHIRALVILMCFTTFALNRSYWSEVSEHDYTSYSEDLRNDVGGGPMGYVGSNGLAAYEAQFVTFLVALAAFERKRLLRVGLIALAVFSAFCIAYSLSRGGYAAILAGCFFIGLIKVRKLLVLVILFLATWKAWVPTAVRERVLMTYDSQERTFDNSAETRLTLWEDAADVIRSNPLFGTGFQTYAYMHRVRNYEDTHNYFLKVLAETGLLGLVLFLAILYKTFWAGFRLFRQSSDPFLGSVGLGLAGWVICATVANCFGDRWTYPQISGYMWILSGLVASGLAITEAPVPGASERSADNTPKPVAVGATVSIGCS
jgi:O-antigen ligase